MRTFKDILDESFERHSAVLVAGETPSGDRSRSILRVVRRRRTIRAAAVTGGAMLVVSALALGAMALNPPLIAQPASTPVITRGLYPWCDVSTYPAVNPEALGAKIYLGRVYADLVNEVYVFADPDGTHTVLELDAAGVARFTTSNGYDQVFAMDSGLREMLLQGPDAHAGYFEDLTPDGGGGGFNPGGPDGPYLGYEWTTVVPDVVPPGIDVAGLSETLGLSLGFGGSGFAPSWAPQGAVVETVFRWHDGRQLAIEIHKDEPGAQVPDYTDLASVSVRVSNLPDGEVFEITSTYDPSMTWQVACWAYRDATSPSATATVGPEPTPSWAHTIAPDPGISQGGFEAGPTPIPSYVTPAPATSSPPSPSAARPSASPSPTS